MLDTGKEKKGDHDSLLLPRPVLNSDGIIGGIRHALRIVGLRYLKSRDQVHNVVEIVAPERCIANAAPANGTGASLEVLTRAGAVGGALTAIADTGDRDGTAAARGRGRGRLHGADGFVDGHGLRVSSDLPEANGELVDGKHESHGRQESEEGTVQKDELLHRHREGHLL
ncbi:hypothetical protein PG990_002854 [Apiospora arundinis]